MGIVTPFCSCSAVPLFIGFLSAGVPLSVTFSFLISAPLVNEVAVALLFGMLGWKVAALCRGPVSDTHLDVYKRQLPGYVALPNVG